MPGRLAVTATQPPAFRPGTTARSKLMLDVILLAAGLGFFVLSIAYAYGCERL
jgi:hypothetical protein